MNRTARDKRENAPKPVKKIELSEKNKRLRLIAVILFLCIGVGFLIYGFMSFLSPKTGWNAVTCNIPDADEFVFQYNFNDGGVNYSVANKQITELYSGAMEKCTRLFDEQTEYDGVVNLCTINKEPGITQQVDELLYQTLSMFSENRYLYFAPIYNRYRNVFSCIDDSQLSDYLPSLNPDVKAETEKLTKFALDSNSVDLQLLGDNKVKLVISDEYRKYAEEQGITDFIGLTRFRNAFFVDYAADVMEQNGFTAGNIVSYDGFTRNMDSSGEEYALNVFDRKGNEVFPAAIWRYKGKMSIVSMRSYPINSYDSQRFYEKADGEILTDYINQEGIFRTAADNLICFSQKKCSEVALAAADIFTAETLDANALTGLSGKGIDSIYCDGYNVRCTDKNAVIGDFFNKDGVSYR